MPRDPSGHVLDFRCLACGATQPPSWDATTCLSPAHGEGAERGILDVRYNYDGVRKQWKDATDAGLRAGIWRWRPLLPIGAPDAPLLPVGGTPLVPAPRLAKRLGLSALWLKDETRNPTRSLKDRATAIAMAIAERQGAGTVCCASAGNAAISLAGFAANAGVDCHVYVPREASHDRLAWLEQYGAHVHVSLGNYDHAFDECESAARSRGWYSRNCAYNPFLVEGKKTAAFEIVDALGGSVPDAVVAPVGDGCTLGALGKGFRELRLLGVTAAIPALVGVQSEAVSPLVSRNRGEAWVDEGRSSRAASISVRKPRNAVRVLAEVKESGGTLLAVTDDEMTAAQHSLSAEGGVVAEVTSAATLAAVEALVADGQLAGARVVLVITGGRWE